MSSALARSLREISERLEDALVAEEISQRDGWLQSLDARLKLASILSTVVAASLARSLVVLGALCALALLLAWASAIPSDVLVRRVWLAALLLTGIVALPALFMTPGPALLRLPLGLIITRTGATTVLYLLLRVGASVSFSLLLVLTTPWANLLRALTVLHVPDVIVLVLGMTYRYIYVLLRITNEMFLSRQSRVLRRLSSQEARSIEGAIAGALLSRSLHISSEVYLAMQSRGFRGYGRVLEERQRPSWRDYVSVGGAAVVLAASIVIGRVG